MKAMFREILAVNDGDHSFHKEMFTVKNSNDVCGKENCCDEVTNKFTALENLEAEVEINNA
jgi:hypothetical protein